MNKTSIALLTALVLLLLVSKKPAPIPANPDLHTADDLTNQNQ